jgi:hypothetical protein
MDLLMVDGLMWCLSLKLQQLLLEFGDQLHPLLKLDVLRLHVVLNVDVLVGMDIHLLTGAVEQHMGVVSSMLGVTKTMVSIL